MADDVRIWSDELARDPSSLVFLPLSETLRKRGQVELARKVAARGLERHPQNPDAHDQMARILVDAGDLNGANEEWETVLRLVPGHTGALKGLAFVRFQQGALEESERLLMEAGGSDPGSAGGGELAAAIRHVRRSSAATRMSVTAELVADYPDSTASGATPPADPRRLFSDILGSDCAILLDRDGLVLAGSYLASDGQDVADDVGATLSGVSGEAAKATRRLEIGDWRSIVFEAENAVVTMAPAPAAGDLAAGGLIVVAAARNTPLGQLKRLLDKCLARAATWLSGGSA